MNRRHLVLLTFLLPLVFFFNGTAWAERWVVYDYYYNGNGLAGSIYFDFDGSNLSLGSSSFGYSTYNDTITNTLLFSGSWAVLGSVQDNALVPDPYARFVQTSAGSGSIVWAPDTPYGYCAPLLLGSMFSGNGAATYQSVQQEVPGTLVVWTRANRSGLFVQNYYLGVQHTFYAINETVPEPSSLPAVLCGLGGVVGVSLRRKR